VEKLNAFLRFEGSGLIKLKTPLASSIPAEVTPAELQESKLIAHSEAERVTVKGNSLFRSTWRWRSKMRFTSSSGGNREK
jgi:hypothetical protein